MQNPRSDDMLLAIARESKGIDDLLDTMFSFLRRRTDFFSGATTDRAEEAILAAARRQHAIAQRELAHKHAEAEAKKAAKIKDDASRKSAPKKAAVAAKPAATAPVKADAQPGTVDAKATPAAAAATSSAAAATTGDGDVAAAAAAAAAASTEEAAGGGAAGEEGLTPSAGNGYDHGSYSWTQTLKEVTVMVRVPSGIKGRDVAVDITSTRLSAGIKGQAAALSGEFFAAVTPDECTWTLEDAPASEGGGRLLSIILAKSYGMQWWSNVVKTEPAINLAKVEPENSKLSDLDPETHKTVAKMMFDSRQKAMGKPTSDELDKQSALAKFMAQHPEMDFSQAKLS